MRYLLSLFAATLFFVACKKEDTPGQGNSKYGQRIYVEAQTPAEIAIRIIGGDSINMLPTGITVTASYLKTSDVAWTEWKKVPVTSNRVSLIEGIEPNAVYDIKLEVTDATQTVVIDKKTIRISAITFDVDKLKREDSLYLTYLNKIYSLEGAVHKVYGQYFSRATITGQLVERADTNKKISVTINTLNDSTLTFQVPKVLSTTSYEYEKQYYLKLNKQYFRWNEGDTMIYNVTSNTINIDSLTYFPDTTGAGCHTLVFKEYFGLAGFNLDADSAYGIPLKVSLTHMSISNASGEILGSYDVSLNRGSSDCGTASTGFGWDSWSQVRFLYLRSGLPQGSYTLIVYNDMVDGTRKLSNQFKFTF